MSKSLLVIVSLCLLITIIYCASACQDKYVYNYDNPNIKGSYSYIDSEGNTVEVPDAIPKFEDGSERKVWNHAHSCNALGVKGKESTSSCCYLHLEYKSQITGERYDKYGCIDVLNPWKDYGGKKENAEQRAKEVKDFLLNTSYASGDPSEKKASLVSEDNLHTKILCNTNFLRLSLSALLVLILF